MPTSIFLAAVAICIGLCSFQIYGDALYFKGK